MFQVARVFVFLPLVLAGPARRVKREILVVNEPYSLQSTFSLPPAVMNRELAHYSLTNSVEEVPKSVDVWSQLSTIKKKIPVPIFGEYRLSVVTSHYYCSLLFLCLDRLFFFILEKLSPGEIITTESSLWSDEPHTFDKPSPFVKPIAL